jgi:hypothetical protein
MHRGGGGVRLFAERTITAKTPRTPNTDSNISKVGIGKILFPVFLNPGGKNSLGSGNSFCLIGRAE